MINLTEANNFRKLLFNYLITVIIMASVVRFSGKFGYHSAKKQLKSDIFETFIFRYQK